MKTRNYSDYSFHISSLATLLLIALLPFSSNAANFPEPGDAANGSKVWADNCSRCHNMRSPTDLSDEQWIASIFHMRVRAGLTGQEARDVLTFLQASNGAPSASGDAVIPAAYQPVANKAIDGFAGKDIYGASCIACHGANGKGSIPGVPDFTKAGGPLSQEDEQLLRNVIDGIQSPGSLMPMPARGGNAQLSDEELSAALKYIKQSFKP